MWYLQRMGKFWVANRAAQFPYATCSRCWCYRDSACFLKCFSIPLSGKKDWSAAILKFRTDGASGQLFIIKWELFEEHSECTSAFAAKLATQWIGGDKQEFETDKHKEGSQWLAILFFRPGNSWIIHHLSRNISPTVRPFQIPPNSSGYHMQIFD